MKKASKSVLLILLILSVIFTLSACSSDDGIDYDKIETITVDEASIADGFLLSDFDISKVLLNVKYLDTKDAKGNTVRGETIQIPVTLSMVVAEDKAQLSVPGTKTIHLVYGKFDVAFVLKLYDDTVQQFKVVFLREDGSVLFTDYVAAGGKATQPTVPQKANHDFLGWLDRDSNQFSSYDNITKNTTLIAYYAPKTFTVIYYTRVVNNIGAADGTVGGGSSTPNVSVNRIGTATVPRGGNALDYAPNIPIIQGFSNGRWENTDSMRGISANSEFYAVYDQDSVVVTFNYKKYDAISVDDSRNYYVGSVIEDNFDAEQAGYKFVGWFTESGKKITFPYTITNEMRFIAKYIDLATGNEGLSYRLIEDYTLTAFVPADWNVNWKNYYRKTGSVYEPVTDEVCPLWTSGTYYFYGSQYIVDGFDGAEDVVVIPDKYNGIDVTGIAPGVFADYGIKEFVVSPTNRYFKVDAGVLYNFAKDRLLAYPTLKTDATFSIERGTAKVYSIADYAFKNAKYLVSVNLGNNLLDIGKGAFENCYLLNSVTVPASVRTINDGAFKMSKSSALSSITFLTPSALTEIGDEAFYGLNKLTTIDIPASVSSIGSGVFTGCKFLERITVAENNVNFIVSDGLTPDGEGNLFTAGGLYDADFTTLYCFPANYLSSNKTDIVLPSSLTLIKSGAFSFTKLQGIFITSLSIELENESIVTPNLVYLRINSDDFNYHGGAFGDYSPRHIFTENENVHDDLIADSSLNSDIRMLSDVDWKALEDFNNNFIYEIVIYEVTENNRTVTKRAITILGGRKTQQQLVIPDAMGEINITKIAPYAFANDDNIVTVTLPNAVEEVGEYAFYGIPNLTTVYLNDNITSIGYRAFAGSARLSVVEFSDLVNITYFGVEAFDGTEWYNSETQEYLTINNLLVKFNGYDISAEIAEGITYIASNAFANKTNLTEIIFKSTVLNTIGYRAFQLCTGLGSVVLPASIRNIGKEAFYGCSNLLLAVINGNKSLESQITIDPTAFPNSETLRTAIRYAEGDNYYVLYYQIDEAETKSEAGTIFVKALSVEDNANKKFAGWYYDKEFTTLVEFPLTLNNDNTVDAAGVRSMRIYARFIEASEGTPGLLYQLNDTGYTVTGYTGTDKYVIIPQRYKNRNVTEIADEAFKNRTDVVSVNFPYARNPATSISYTFITNVGENAFDDTKWFLTYRGDFVIINDVLIKYKGSATVVEIPSSITKIADGAFAGNTFITKVVVPEGVRILGKNMFRDCINLVEVKLPSTTASIGDNAFAGCEKLEKINFEDAAELEVISSSALDNTLWLESRIDDCIIINDILYKFQGMAGAGAEGKLTVMNGITQIADRAFENDRSLKKIYLPESVTYIGSYAFSGSLIREVIIFAGGSDLEAIGEYAFASCINLSRINLSVCSALKTIGAFAFANTPSLYSDDTTALVLPSAINLMNEGAFRSSGVVNAIFAAGSKLKELPYQAFAECSNLSSVIFNGASALTAIGEEAFAECISLNVFSNVSASIETIGARAFNNCVYLNNLDINSSRLKDIGAAAFYNMGYVNNFNANMVVVGNILIKYKGNDAVVEIPSTITTIYDSAFAGNTTLREIRFPVNSRINAINDNAFLNCRNLEYINFPSSIISVGDSVVANTLWYDNMIRSGVEFVTIGNTLIRYNGSSRQVVIPQNVTIINRGAFDGVELYNIEIGAHVTLIKEGAFDGIITPSEAYEKGRYILTECETADDFVTARENSINNYGSYALYYFDGGELKSTTLFVQGVSEYYIFDSHITTVAGSWSITLLNPRPFDIGQNTINEIYLVSEEAREDYLLDIRWDSYSPILKVARPFTLTLSVDPDKAEIGAESVEIAVLYDEIPLTVKEGYVFIGWYVDFDKEIAVRYPLKLHHSFTVYAKFASLEDGTQKGFSRDTDTHTEIVSYNDNFDKTVVIPRQIADFEFNGITGYWELANPPYTYGTHVWNPELSQYVPEPDEERATHYYKGAFMNHTEIEVIYFANNSQITVIGRNAFAGCTSLKKIVLPAGITLIEEDAFAGCTSLTEIIFTTTDPAVSITIESGAFRNCTALKSIVFPANISSWGDGAFEGCTSLVDIYLEDTEPGTVENLNGAFPFEINEGRIKIYVKSAVYNIYYSRWSAYATYLTEVTDEE